MLQQPRVNSNARPNTNASAPAPAPRREPTQEEIRKRAYELFEKRNREPGHEKEDWAQAERELRQGRTK